jgi:hypothetical protein
MAFSNIAPYEVTVPEFLKRLQCSDVSEGQDAYLNAQVIGDPSNHLKLYKLKIFKFLG